jgi:hypothetical protein
MKIKTGYLHQQCSPSCGPHTACPHHGRCKKCQETNQSYKNTMWLLVFMFLYHKKIFFFFDKQEKYIKREVVQGIPQPLQ